MASLMVSGNDWSCVQTGDGLYAELLEREIPRNFEDTKQYAKYTKIISLLNSWKLFLKVNQQKVRTNVDIFV